MTTETMTPETQPNADQQFAPTVYIAHNYTQEQAPENTVDLRNDMYVIPGYSEPYTLNGRPEPRSAEQASAAESGKLRKLGSLVTGIAHIASKPRPTSPPPSGPDTARPDSNRPRRIRQAAAATARRATTAARRRYNLETPEGRHNAAADVKRAATLGSAAIRGFRRARARRRP